MKLKFFSSCAAIIALSLSASTVGAKSNKVVVQVAEDNSFIDFGIVWDSGIKGYIGRVKVIEIDGKVGLCGVGTFRDAQYRSASIQVLRKYTLEMNGKTILKDFMFFWKSKQCAEIVWG